MGKSMTRQRRRLHGAWRPGAHVSARQPAKRPSVRLRYLWDSQTVIAINPCGTVVAAEPLAKLIVAAPRRNGQQPTAAYGYEIEALREAVVAEAQLAGHPAPAGWSHRIHGRAIHSSRARDVGLSEAPPPRLPEGTGLEDADD